MERLGLTGVLELSFYKNGILINKESRKNMIVTSGWLNLFSALSGESGETNHIVKVQCGTNGTPPDATDTVITNHVDLVITNKTATSGSLIIEFALGIDDANGTTIAEFGTICANGDLFSRKEWTPFLKTSDISVNGTWIIKKA